MPEAGGKLGLGLKLVVFAVLKKKPKRCNTQLERELVVSSAIFPITSSVLPASLRPVHTKLGCWMLKRRVETCPVYSRI